MEDLCSSTPPLLSSYTDKATLARELRRTVRTLDRLLLHGDVGCPRKTLGQQPKERGIARSERIFAHYGSKDYTTFVSAPTDRKPRLFASKNFMRFARRFGASEQDLWAAVQELPDANLGGGVFKFRLARKGEGTSGGARVIVAMKTGHRILMMYGFDKKDLANIRPDELKQFRASAKIYLGLSESQMTDLTEKKVLTEIKPKTGHAGQNE